MFFTNKNLNWEITTKDLVTFKPLKDAMKLRMKNLILWGSLKNLIVKSFAKNQNIEGQIA